MRPGQKDLFFFSFILRETKKKFALFALAGSPKRCLADGSDIYSKMYPSTLCVSIYLSVSIYLICLFIIYLTSY